MDMTNDEFIDLLTHQRDLMIEVDALMTEAWSLIHQLEARNA